MVFNAPAHVSSTPPDPIVTTMTPSLPPAGWYPNPDAPGQQRYWDGAAWTNFSTGREPAAPSIAAPGSTGAALRRWRPTLSTWITGAIALLVAIIGIGTNGFGGFLVGLSLFGLGAGIWTVVRRSPSWLNLPRTRTAGWAAIGISTSVLLLGAAIAPHPQTIDHAQGASAGTSIVATASAAPTDKFTPTPTPTPVKTVQIAETSEQIGFNKTSYEDANVDAGTNVVVTAGAAGTKVSKWEITQIGGVEVSRALISETVTVTPVDEVTAIGTRQAPPPEAAPAPDEGNGCDPNYAGACVPIASDVDCSSGKGNGPAYVAGPVQVVGSDIYDLDSNGDGVGCERG